VCRGMPPNRKSIIFYRFFYVKTGGRVLFYAGSRG